MEARFVCPGCGREHGYLYCDGYCFSCKNADNPFRGVGVSLEVSPEDAAPAERRQAGSHIFNLGLPGVETIVGKRRDGKPKLQYRPVTHNEIGSKNKRNDYARRHGLEPSGDGALKRAV